MNEPELCKAKPDPKPCFTKGNNKGGSWIIDLWSMIHQIEPELCRAKPVPKPCFTKSNNKGGSWIIDLWSMIRQIEPELCKAKPDRIHSSHKA